MRNLTEEQARERAAAVTVSSYDIALDLTMGEAEFGSRTTVSFSATEGASTFLELDCARVITASLDGRPLSLQGNQFLLDGLGGEHQVVVDAVCSFTRSGEGLHRFVDPADDQVYVYANAFLDDAQRFFACFDQPDLKAPVRLRVTAPEGHRVLANQRGELRDGTWVFAETAPLSTYLVTLAAGPWHGEQRWFGSRDHGGVELGVWCRRSMAPYLEAEELLEITEQCMEQQQQAFGSRFPFGDSYDQVFVPEFNAGAMENPGMVTLSDEGFLFRSRTTEGRRRLRAQVIAHEMAHMWFGDLVTMRWWDGVWLNESFAEFMGLHTIEATTRFHGAWSDFCLGRKAWGYRADQLPSTHPVAGPVPDTRSALLNFDGISYAKGASVLRQLVAFVGEETFFVGLQDYLARHAYGNTDLADLLQALERASGRPLDTWAASWLETSGVATLRARWTESGLQIAQEGEPLRDHVLCVGLYDRAADGTLALRERPQVAVSGSVTEVDLAPAALTLLNDGDLTFAKIRFDEQSLAVVLTDLKAVPDALARALCWGALWDACRDAELPASRYVEAVLANVGAEDDPSLVETLLGQAARAAATYSTDGAALSRQIAQACWTAEVVPGSDLQLVRVRAAVATTDDRALLAGLLDGTGVPAGVTVDAELRWHVVRRAAALGALDQEQIGEELAADRTASGQLQAEAALASLPDPAVKERTWAALIGGGVTNAQARTMGAAFWQVGQEELLEPWVERYVADVPALWEASSPQVAQSLTQHLFPHTLVRADVADRTAALLTGGDLPAGARRVVLEQLDDLRRALRTLSSG
jgi:aminopeptidase N